MARPSRLPVHPRELTLSALRGSSKPLTAYQLLEKMRLHGVRAAPTVYRALKSLMAEGLVHRIQTTGAYMACSCVENHAHALSVLTICHQCHAVRELHDHTVIGHLEVLRDLHINLSDAAMIELPVTCEKCAA